MPGSSSSTAAGVEGGRAGMAGRSRSARLRFGRWAGTLAAVVALIALQSGPTAGAATPVAAASNGAQPAPTVVGTLQTPLGLVLVDGTRMPLYVFSGDAGGDGPPGVSCLPTNRVPAGIPGAGTPCTTAWPPLLAAPGVTPVASQGVKPDHLGTVMRAGIGLQITYFGQPLYRFVKDTAGGKPTGQDVTAFLGIFRLVSIDGRPAADQASIRLELSADGPVLDTPTAFGATRTLYRLSADPLRATTCTGGCAAVWPPVLTNQVPTAGPGVNHDWLGIFHRPDGTFQVTYFGVPLYMFAFDLAPFAPSGLTNGNNFVDPFANGVWHTVTDTGLPAPGAVGVQTETDPKLGRILATSAATPFNPGATTATLYAFSGDSATAGNCVSACARAWPPLLTSEPPVAGPGATAGLIGSIQRSDGSFQITYNGHPLYLFSRELTPKTTGEGIHAFGGTFKVLDPTGAAV